MFSNFSPELKKFNPKGILFSDRNLDVVWIEGEEMEEIEEKDLFQEHPCQEGRGAFPECGHFGAKPYGDGTCF